MEQDIAKDVVPSPEFADRSVSCEPSSTKGGNTGYFNSLHVYANSDYPDRLWHLPSHVAIRWKKWTQNPDFSAPGVLLDLWVVSKGYVRMHAGCSAQTGKPSIPIGWH